MNSVPIGIYEKAFPDVMTLREKLDCAKKVGFDFFELSLDECDERLARLKWSQAEKSRLVEDVNQSGIPILSMCLSGHRRFPFGSRDAEIRARSMEILQDALLFCQQTGIRTIQLAGYDVYYEPSTPQSVAYFTEGLRMAARLAQQANIMLAIEIMDTEFINSIEKAMKYVQEINSPWLQIYPDIGNLSAWGMDFEKEFTVGSGHLVAAHVKETKSGVYRDLRFGEGTVDFEKAFSILHSMNFPGPFLIEMWAKEDENPLEAVSEALFQVKEKLRMGGYVIC